MEIREYLLCAMLPDVVIYIRARYRVRFDNKLDRRVAGILRQVGSNTYRYRILIYELISWLGSG